MPGKTKAVFKKRPKKQSSNTLVTSDKNNPFIFFQF